MPRPRYVLEQRIRVAETSVGRGVFAARSFRKGQVIGVVGGEVIRDAAYWSYYCIDLGGDLSLEPAEPFRFLNHRCTPNAEIVWVDSDDPSADPPVKLLLQALRTIRPGEELTIDYAWSAEGAMKCLCGSAECRGWIVMPEELHLVPR